MTNLTHSYYCGASDTQILYQTIGNYFDRICEKFTHAEALVVRYQHVRWSYRQLQTEVNRLAAGLLALGIAPGDRVGIWGANSYEWVMVQYATAKIGAIMVCINPAYRLYELEYALNKVGCRAIVCAERLCIPVPLYHCFGMVLGNLACLAHGATAVYPDAAFDALATLQAVQE